MREKKKNMCRNSDVTSLTGCSSQEVLSEVPQTIVLPESQIDTLPMQQEIGGCRK